MNMKKHSGFTLIEVLVALLVLAVGLLGVAALQFRGIQYSQGALMRSMASTLASDITEKIRANKTNAAQYVGTWTVGTSAPTGCNPVTAASATNDLACWRAQVFSALPPGSTADITANGAHYTLTITWTDRDGTQHPIVYPFL